MRTSPCCATLMGMPVVSLTLSYNGAPFCGFARQPDQLTVQGELERALELLFKREVPTTCAGRTDSGVHAQGQVVSFDLAPEEWAAREVRTLLRSLNAITHEGISVHAAQERPDGFSARFSAKAREYHYYVSTQAAPPLVMRDFCWHKAGELDVAAMNEGAACLLGEHDFKSFCLAASAEGKPTVRDLYVCEVEPVEVLGEPLLRVRVVGSSFLHSMVRTIVGTLVAVGAGLREPSWVSDVLAARDRSAAGEKAPACGLILASVEY